MARKRTEQLQSSRSRHEKIFPMISKVFQIFVIISTCCKASRLRSANFRQVWNVVNNFFHRLQCEYCRSPGRTERFCQPDEPCCTLYTEYWIYKVSSTGSTINCQAYQASGFLRKLLELGGISSFCANHQKASNIKPPVFIRSIGYSSVEYQPSIFMQSGSELIEYQAFHFYGVTYPEVCNVRINLLFPRGGTAGRRGCVSSRGIPSLHNFCIMYQKLYWIVREVRSDCDDRYGKFRGALFVRNFPRRVTNDEFEQRREMLILHMIRHREEKWPESSCYFHLPFD